MIQPQNKPKGQPLDSFDRFINRQKARIRFRVEHAIGRVKRYGALTQPYRNHRPYMDVQLMLVACGLWNLYLKDAASKISADENRSSTFHHATTLIYRYIPFGVESDKGPREVIGKPPIKLMIMAHEIGSYW